MTDHLAYPRRMRGVHADVSPEDYPATVWFDPGETVGWSVMQVHPDCLRRPDIPILGNITAWEHGQISAAPLDKLVGARWEGARLSARNVARYAGGGYGVDFTAEYRAVQKMLDVVNRWPGCAVGIESFVVRRYDQSTEFLSPVRITSAFEYALWRIGVPLLRQSPSDAKTTATDARLRLWKLYERDGGMNHARDADRHAITFLRGCKDLRRGTFRRALAWPHIYGAD